MMLARSIMVTPRPCVLRGRWSVGLLLAVVCLLAGCGGAPEFVGELPAVPDLSGRPAEFQGIVRTADKAAREGRKSLEAVGRLARFYYINGFLDEAWSCLGILVERDPGNPQWFHFLATLLAGYGYLEEAIPLWEHVLEVAPDFVVAPVRLGDALHKLGRPDEAEAVLWDALTRFPEQPYVLSGLGRIAADQERWDDARDLLERASRASRFRTGVDLLATVYERLGRPEAAADLKRESGFGTFIDIRDPWMEALLVFCYDADRLANAGGQANFYGDAPRGLELLRRAVALAPNDAMIHYQLGQMAMDAGDDTLADSHLRRCVQLKPDLSDGWLYLLTLYARQGRFAESEDALSHGLENCPDSPSLHLERGKRLQQAGLVTDAIREFRRAGELRPNEAGAFVLLSGAYFGINRLDEGLAALEQALAAEPGNRIALASLAYYYIQTGNRAEAEKWIATVRAHPRMERETIDRLEQAFAAAFPAVSKPR